MRRKQKVLLIAHHIQKRQKQRKNQSIFQKLLRKTVCSVGMAKGHCSHYIGGEENIGVISLNTFDLAHVEINRYDDNGKLIEEPAKGSSTRITSTGEDGSKLRNFHSTSTEDGCREVEKPVILKKS